MSEPTTGFAGDQESGGWAGEPDQQLFTAGGVIGSRSADGSELDPLHGAASVPVGQWPPSSHGAASVPVGQWPPSSWGPKRYVIDQSGNQVAG